MAGTVEKVMVANGKQLNTARYCSKSNRLTENQKSKIKNQNCGVAFGDEF
jgi:hypothetical protein